MDRSRGICCRGKRSGEESERGGGGRVAKLMKEIHNKGSFGENALCRRWEGALMGLNGGNLGGERREGLFNGQDATQEGTLPTGRREALGGRGGAFGRGMLCLDIRTFGSRSREVGSGEIEGEKVTLE